MAVAIFRELAGTPSAVAKATVKAIQNLGYGITGQAAGQITFKTGFSGRSWGGQHMTATLMPAHGKVRVVMTGTRNVWQAYDWGEAEAIGSRVLQAIEIPTTPEPGVELAQNLTNRFRWAWNVLIAVVMLAGGALVVVAFGVL